MATYMKTKTFPYYAIAASATDAAESTAPPEKSVSVAPEACRASRWSRCITGKNPVFPEPKDQERYSFPAVILPVCFAKTK